MSKITSSDIVKLLDEKFKTPAEAMIAFEVADGTGGNATRRADAISVDFWPSKGLSIIGYEIKVSRSDWLNEMKQPEKSNPISKYCDKFYLVAPIGVLRIDELPKTWGYICASENGLRTEIKAPQREAAPLEKPFMMSLIRNMVTRYLDPANQEASVQRAHQRGYKQAEENAKFQLERAREDALELENRIKDFEKNSGIKIDRWGWDTVGHGVKALMDSRTDSKKLDNTIQRLATIVADRTTEIEVCTKAINELKAFSESNVEIKEA